MFIHFFEWVPWLFLETIHGFLTIPNCPRKRVFSSEPILVHRAWSNKYNYILKLRKLTFWQRSRLTGSGWFICSVVWQSLMKSCSDEKCRRISSPLEEYILCWAVNFEKWHMKPTITTKVPHKSLWTRLILLINNKIFRNVDWLFRWIQTCMRK